LRSKAHTAPTALLVLHRTKIGKCAIKIFGINCQLWNKLFHRHSLVKAAMNDQHLCKLRKECLTGICHGAMVLTKRLYFLIFQLSKAGYCTQHNSLPNWQLKNKRRSNILHGSQRMGGGQNPQEYLPASPFNKDQSNETTFSPFHLAGQNL
jgi:hypothetical protein